MNRERGASAVEYALLVAGVCAVLIFIVVATGDTLGELFEHTVETSIEN